ncbi:MAG: 3D domain-containing protein [Gaiellaceae bacterium]
MREEGRTARRIRLLTLAAALAGAIVPTAVGTGPATSLRTKAAQLSQKNAVLGARSRGAVISLYALNLQLSRAQAQMASLEAQGAVLRHRRESVQRQVGIARGVLDVAERHLARRLQILYEQGDTDPLEVVLGATSLDDALSNLETLNSSATADHTVISEALNARDLLRRLDNSLALRDAALRKLEASARSAAASLGSARAERVHYLAQLASQRRLNASQISSLESQAAAVEAQAQRVAIENAGSTLPAPPTPSPGSSQTLTVIATGYSLQGRTATGAPVGWGVVAVDPSVIPLGTGMTIPGYGEGVAADTGGGIRGAVIDLWFPSAAAAAAWGRRTVTIILH